MSSPTKEKQYTERDYEYSFRLYLVDAWLESEQALFAARHRARRLEALMPLALAGQRPDAANIIQHYAQVCYEITQLESHRAILQPCYELTYGEVPINLSATEVLPAFKLFLESGEPVFTAPPHKA